MTHPRDCLPYIDPSKPVGPSNLVVYTPFLKAVLDLQWDDPNLLCHNMEGGFDVVGVNIYRAQTETGPYTKINSAVIDSTSYRDVFGPTFVSKEVVSDKFTQRGFGPTGEWALCVEKYPIVEPECGKLTRSPLHVILEIDGVVVPVRSVLGASGEVYLHHEPYIDLECGSRPKDPPLPSEGSEVLISYYTLPEIVSTSLSSSIFYKVTSVDSNGNETPLSQAEPATFQSVEAMGYIWKEAISRNRWILEQGGERVLAFLQKTMGERCQVCFDNPELQHTHRQPRNNCKSCFGTGFVGGYIGPIPILIAPKTGERAIELGPQGLHMNFVWQTWTSNFPIVRQRDFIRSQAGEIFALGPVERFEHRGLVLQQHFSVSHIDTTDIRYKVPIDGFVPLITNKPNIDDAIEIRGRTLVFENHHY